MAVALITDPENGWDTLGSTDVLMQAIHAYPKRSAARRQTFRRKIASSKPPRRLPLPTRPRGHICAAFSARPERRVRRNLLLLIARLPGVMDRPEWLGSSNLVPGRAPGAGAKLRPLLEAYGHEAVAIDLPGHGEDRTPPESVTFQDYVDRTIAAVQASRGDSILVGHSMGGAIVARPPPSRRIAFEPLFP